MTIYNCSYAILQQHSVCMAIIIIKCTSCQNQLQIDLKLRPTVRSTVENNMLLIHYSLNNNYTALPSIG